MRNADYYAPGPPCLCGCGLNTERSGGKKTRAKNEKRAAYGAFSRWIPYRKYILGHRPSGRKLPEGEGPRRNFIRKYKNGAKRRNIVFLLSDEEVIKLSKGDCFYCGIEPQQRTYFTCQKKPMHYICNGIDRKDSSLGYVSGNVVSCCAICNIAKSDKPFEEFLSWIRRLVNYHGNKMVV